MESNGGINLIEAGNREIQFWNVDVPPHRFEALKEAWMEILTAILEEMKVDVHMNLEKCRVELKMMPDTPTNSNILGKCEKFVKAIMLGFDVKVAYTLLHSDELVLRSWQSHIKGDCLLGTVKRLCREDKGITNKSAASFEKLTRTHIVVADSWVHLLGSPEGTNIARFSIAGFLHGLPALMVFRRLRVACARRHRSRVLPSLGNSDINLVMESNGGTNLMEAGNRDLVMESNGWTNLMEAGNREIQFRKVDVPPHRFEALKEAWMEIQTAIPEEMKVDVHMNLEKSRVELKAMSNTQTNSNNLDKCEEFVRAFMLGFDVKVACTLLHSDELVLRSWPGRTTGDRLSRAVKRLCREDEGIINMSAASFEKLTRTHFVAADSWMYMLGSPEGIVIARSGVTSFINGLPRFTVFRRLRAACARRDRSQVLGLACLGIKCDHNDC